MQRRLLSVLIVGTLVGLPAAALRFACVGKSCPAAAASAPPVPFCPLPAELKREIADGYVEGRSPDVLGVPNTGGAVRGGTGPTPEGLDWPAVSPAPDTSVPIVFQGTGVQRRSLPPGTGLDQIAPTLSSIMGLRRSNPNVRAGTTIPGVARGAHPALVLIVAWAGIGSSDLSQKMPWLRGAMESGAGTIRGSAGSVPLDPASTVTTIGTGGLPRQHGITGSLLLGPGAAPVPAWGAGAPRSIIATLADDWSHAQADASIGLIAPSAVDRGLIGGNWYVGHGPVDLRIGGDPLTAADSLLRQGYGADGTTDILGVVLDGPARHVDAQTASLITMADRATGGSVTVAVAGTGSMELAKGSASSPGATTTGAEVASRIDAQLGAPGLVAGVAADGVFLS
ncbi:MAG: hypothetical protein ABI828_02530, partial [Actinomycetota bacterium]